MAPTLEEKKATARREYIAAREAWSETRTPGNPNGDPARWTAFCNAKRLCMQFGVRI